jgi:phosphatidylglycerophosphatase A
MSFAMLVATLGGAGRLRPGPGTFGSAVVLPLVLLGPLACLALAALLCVAGYWAATQVAADPQEDPGWFVADEGVGMLLALAALPAAGWLGVVLAFALFRVFDIAKPWPVSWADRQPGAFGIMLDDVIAGAMAAGLLLLLGSLAPEVLR